ncbi:MAG: PIN domain-containing protein [Spirochaetales bacterium]|jgi:predicted nucleic acid-binding protein|nr:PIN domain-containing protein [Spirochaetales bacterium]
MLSYFDSSIILALLFNEQRQFEAYSLWKNAGMKVSSLLLEIETIISLRRAYKNSNYDKDWLDEKENILSDYLESISYIVADQKIAEIIRKNREIANCRSLDAIHIATALEYREITGENINLYTFDTSMHNLAEYYKFNTNAVNSA